MKFAFFVQTHPNWSALLFILSWVYLALAIFEPSCANDALYVTSWKYKYRTACIAIEGTIIFFYIIDFILAVYHRSHKKYKRPIKKISKNKMLIFKAICLGVFIADYVRTNVIFPIIPVRFSRFFRPGIYSQWLRFKHLTSISDFNILPQAATSHLRRNC